MVILVFFWSCQLAHFQHRWHLQNPFHGLYGCWRCPIWKDTEKVLQKWSWSFPYGFTLQRKQIAWVDIVCGQWSLILVSSWWKDKIQLNSLTAIMQNYILDKFSLTFFLLISHYFSVHLWICSKKPEPLWVDLFSELSTQHNNLVNLIFPVEFQLIGIIINFDM